MIEVGLGLFAACLPTIRFLFKGFSPDSVANSVRSAFSLSSMRSNRSRIYDEPNTTQGGEISSTASNVNIVGSRGKGEASFEAYAMDDHPGPGNI
jgi:hypothetical protein